MGADRNGRRGRRSSRRSASISLSKPSVTSRRRWPYADWGTPPTRPNPNADSPRFDRTSSWLSCTDTWRSPAKRHDRAPSARQSVADREHRKQGAVEASAEQALCIKGSARASVVSRSVSSCCANHRGRPTAYPVSVIATPQHPALHATLAGDQQLPREAYADTRRGGGERRRTTLRPGCTGSLAGRSNGRFGSKAGVSPSCRFLFR
jgi:hypothetical protein